MEQILIYVIITIILIVSSVKKKKKPTNNSPQQQPTQPKQTESLEELFKRLGGEFFEEQPTNEPTPQPIDEVIMEGNETNPYLEAEQKRLSEKTKRAEARTFRENKYNQSAYTQNIIEETEGYVFNNEDFSTQNMQKAIIYSEIINRKYE
jgi:hypothetical protein